VQVSNKQQQGSVQVNLAFVTGPEAPEADMRTITIINNNKHLRCGNRKGLLGRNDQTHHRMDPNIMDSRPPTVEGYVSI